MGCPRNRRAGRVMVDAGRQRDRWGQPARRHRPRDPDRSAAFAADLDPRGPCVRARRHRGCQRCSRRRRPLRRWCTLGRTRATPKPRHRRLHSNRCACACDRTGHGHLARGGLASGGLDRTGHPRPSSQCSPRRCRPGSCLRTCIRFRTGDGQPRRDSRTARGNCTRLNVGHAGRSVSRSSRASWRHSP